MHHPGWEHIPQTHEAGGSRWAEDDAAALTLHSSDSEGLPPPIQARQTISGWEDVNNRLGGLEIYTSEIQNTLNTHVQDSVQWHQQQQQQMAQMNAMLQLQREQQAAYWRYMGFNPGS